MRFECAVKINKNYYQMYDLRLSLLCWIANRLINYSIDWLPLYEHWNGKFSILKLSFSTTKTTKTNKKVGQRWNSFMFGKEKGKEEEEHAILSISTFTECHSVWSIKSPDNFYIVILRDNSFHETIKSTLSWVPLQFFLFLFNT